jgi:hypothetical protein
MFERRKKVASIPRYAVVVVDAVVRVVWMEAAIASSFE